MFFAVGFRVRYHLRSNCNSLAYAHAHACPTYIGTLHARRAARRGRARAHHASCI